jgi:transcriptional regulator with XRE-family HTH domain
MPTKRVTFFQTLRAQYLGDRMRKLREERGLTLKDVAQYVGVEFSTVARYERAEWPFRTEKIQELLDLYGVFDEPTREALVTLARNAWRINHWHRPDIDAKDPLFPAVDQHWLESRATEIGTCSATLIPDLLQTRDYAHAVTRHDVSTGSAHQVEVAVRAKLERQRILAGNQPVPLVAVIEEHVLHRPVGGIAALRDQLLYLTKVIDDRPIDIRVLPTTTAALHPGVYGSFTVYRRAGDVPDVAWLEHLGGNLIVEAAGATRYTEAHTELVSAALCAVQSAELIDKIAAELN